MDNTRLLVQETDSKDRVAERAKSTMYYNQDLEPEGTAGAHPRLTGDESGADHFTSLSAFDVSLLVVVQRTSRLRR